MSRVNLSALPRPTLIESVLAALLLAESVMELTGPASGDGPAAIRFVVALVAPIAVAFSRSAPAGAGLALTLMWLLDSFPGPAEGTLGAGFAMLAIIFGVAAWAARPWPWILAIFVAGTIRDVRMYQADSMDLFIDWGFVAVCTAAGLAVRYRAAHADRLEGELEVTRAEQERRSAEAVAAERATIARELHDIVAHSVSLMVVQAGTARPLAERRDAELATVLATIEASGRGALDELRRLLAVLRAEEATGLAPLPGIAAIPELVDGVRRTGLAVELQMDGDLELPASLSLCAYRAVQEGLTNALRHTDGSRTSVRLRATPAGVEVLVETRGGRLTHQRDGSGTGLLGLRERVLLSGGGLEVGPTGDGWTLRLVLPVAQQSRADAHELAQSGEPQ